MSFRSLLAAPLLAPLAVLAAASPAWAGHITLEAPGMSAEDPGLAVDAQGTGHVAWTRRASGGDVTVYCRLPRGATACERTQTFKPTDTAGFPAPTVIDRGGGRIEVVVYRSGSGAIAYISSDGGSAFAPGKAVASLETGRGAVGPGADTVGLAEDNVAGARFQFARLDGSLPAQSAYATLGEPNPAATYYARGTALVNASTPLALFTDLTNAQYRIFDPAKGPDFNQAANWGATRTVPGLREPLITSGPAGVFLLGTSGQQVQVRKLDAASGQFGAPFDVARGGQDDPIFPAFSEDAAGGLHAIWVANTDDLIRSAYSGDGGQTWSAPETIDDADRAYNLRVGAAADHGGWVVYDHNETGGIEAVALPAGGATPAPVTPPPATTTTTAIAPPPATTTTTSVVPPPINPAPPASPAIRIETTGLRLKGARATVRIACPNSAPGGSCSGTVLVKRASKTIAREAFTARAGASKAVTFAVPSAVRSIVKRKGKVALRFEATTRSGALAATQVTASGTLRGAKRR